MAVRLFASSACGPCLLALVLLRVPAWTVSLCILWTSYMRSPSGFCATLAAMANARDVISIYHNGSVLRTLLYSLPRLAPWVTLAVRADARDVVYPYIYLLQPPRPVLHD